MFCKCTADILHRYNQAHMANGISTAISEKIVIFQLTIKRTGLERRGLFSPLGIWHASIYGCVHNLRWQLQLQI